MLPDHTAVIETPSGETIEIPLYREGLRDGAGLRIDGVWHHFERISVEDLMETYVVDTDPDYSPKSDPEGFCYLLVPFSK
jgi:hypothetical protein